jgi:hypothetical protein
MQLQPKGPPGRATRKALLYASEVRRLHAEGHTLESIRLALLDAGVSVSISTVRREVVRTPSPRELEHSHAATFPLEQWQSDSQATPMPLVAPTPSLHQGASEQPRGPADGAPASRPLEPVDAHHRAGLFSNTFGLLRRVLRVRGRL